MKKFSRFQLNAINTNDNGNSSRIVIQPLEDGFGTTIGNALRRVCLSSIPGVSVFAIKIPGVTHEFQGINGVFEDVVQIILNLKRLVIKGDQDILSEDELNSKTLEDWPTLKINVKGKRDITAADINCPAGFSIVNTDLHIATLTDDIEFEMEIYAKWDRGYKTAEENKEFVNSISLIPTDSNFSPVLAFNYTVSKVKTSKLVSSDSLEIEIATNGSISANDALVIASKILTSHLEPIININETLSSKLEVLGDEIVETTKKSLFIPIEDLDLTVRAYNALRLSGILTTQEIIDKTKAEIAKIKNLGRKSVNEIIQKIHDRGLKLRDE